MSPANSRSHDEIGELRDALDAQTKLRLDAELRLRQMRDEFREFILTAAHDLREPLRTVSAYCELLTRRIADGPDSDLDQFRRYILDGSVRMQSLITGISEYATAEAESPYLIDVDMNDVFRESLKYPGSRFGDKSILACDILPVVRGDFDKLVKVARHLLDNAARFCLEGECRVHVSSRRDGDDWLFVVRDNGQGIDPAYHRQIFEPFKRLHGKPHAGSGLGLTFCRKAIESLGGRIWVDSQPGEGSTFYFTLPSADRRVDYR